MRQSETIGQLILALSKAQGELNGAAKSSDNPFFKSKYADLHECIEAAKGPLSANKLAVVQTTDHDADGIWVITTLGHESGEWIQGRLRMRPKKDDDQGLGSSITYGRRYGYAAIVGLAQKDDDGNASCENKGDKGAECQQQKPKARSIEEIKKAIKAECSNPADLTAWWKNNEVEVRLMSSIDQKAIITHLAEKKAKYLAAPLSWDCPEGGRVTAIECEACQKHEDCENYRNQKEIK